MEHLFHFSYPQIYLESKYPEENKIIFRVNRHRFMQHEQIKVEDAFKRNCMGLLQEI